MSNKTLPQIPRVLPDKTDLGVQNTQDTTNKNTNSDNLSELFYQVEKLKEYTQSLREENKRLSELVKMDFNKFSQNYENPEFSSENLENLVKERDSYKKLALEKIKDMILEKVKKEYPDLKCTSVDEFPEEFHRLVCARVSPATAYKVISEQKEREAKKPASMGSVNEKSEEEKEFYTSAEADKLTDKQLSNPKVMDAVIKSMLKW